MGRFLLGRWRALLGAGQVVTEEANFLDDLASMDYSHDGLPFVGGATSGELSTMDYSHNGMPFVIWRAT